MPVLLAASDCMLAWLMFPPPRHLCEHYAVGYTHSLCPLSFTLHCHVSAAGPPLPAPIPEQTHHQVDDDDKSDLDDDEIEAINAAGAGGQTTGGDGNATTNGEGIVKDGDAKQTTKSVRMNIGGALLVHKVVGAGRAGSQLLVGRQHHQRMLSAHHCRTPELSTKGLD